MNAGIPSRISLRLAMAERVATAFVLHCRLAGVHLGRFTRALLILAAWVLITGWLALLALRAVVTHG